MRQKSPESDEKQIRSMSVLSSTSCLTVKITQYVPPSQLNLNLNQTVIPSEKVTLKIVTFAFSGSVFIEKFQTVVPRHGLSTVAGFFN
jgi:lipoate synthase